MDIEKNIFIYDYQVFNDEIVVMASIPPFKSLKDIKIDGLIIHDKIIAKRFIDNFEKIKSEELNKDNQPQIHYHGQCTGRCRERPKNST